MAIQTKAIGELKGYQFYVPSYQRGYRWTDSEVTALLDDINEFSAEGGKQYCIQPLIVKKRENGSFEVVDGQQRLTTIYIFMKIAEQEIRSAVPPFSLEYETRKDSAEFLKTLAEKSDADKAQNIDYFHIYSAYEVMNIWLDKQSDKSVAVQKLNTKIRESVIFIWYEILDSDDPIAVFTKVNLGKIPLTSAELIKALLLNADNFAPETVSRRQIAISHDWDRIEQGLRNDSFWYFLNEQEKSGTRIDFLFELLADEYNPRLKNPVQKGQSYFSFFVFAEHLSKSKDAESFVNDVWMEIEKQYAEFNDWYSDLDKYHLIGFMIATGTSLRDIFSLTRGKRKSVVITALLDKIKQIIGVYDLEKTYYENRQRVKIKRLLLLFNIATLVCKSEKQYRFPFDIYKHEKWDIEHIHATADESDEPDDALWNLTLLDQSTNRSVSYACEEFKDKRKVLLARESNGLFVPICTKNIFLKAYSSNLDDMDVWSGDDKTAYICEFNKTLERFLSGGFTK
jgi:hypothetical protein